MPNASEQSKPSTEKELEGYAQTEGASHIVKDPIEPVLGEKGAQIRDEKYTELLSHFSENYHKEKKQSLLFKKIFFGIIIGLFCALGISGIVILFLALFFKTDNMLSIVIASSVEVISSFIAIPTIIAKNLFPEKVDEQIVKMTEILIKNDMDVRYAREHRSDKYKDEK